jgi:AAA ATPase-like protein
VRETLNGRVAARDAARFVGRAAELARLEGLVGDDRPVTVVLLHGPGGVGKSALMRELARRAAARGATPVTVEARGLAPLAEELDQALAPAMTARRPLVMLDSWERLEALDGHLRRHLLPRLPADALVVIASRHAPGRSWFSAGWDHVVLDLPLSPLDTDEANALLAIHGMQDPTRRAAAVAWAGGSPLALVLVADGPADLPAGGDADVSPAVIDALLQRLLDVQPEGDGRAVLAVAALARVTTPALLATVLPDVDAGRWFAWLCEHPSAEPLDDGVTLHDVVARTLCADLRHRTPALERDLRRRLVDALYARGSVDGLLRRTLDIQHLVQDPAIRWGFAWDPSSRLRIDTPRLGDPDAIAARSGRAARVWLADARRWFDEAPECVTVVRDEDDVIAGYGIAATPANAPAFAAEDPIIGPRLRHAARKVPGGAAVVFRQAVDLTHGSGASVTSLLGLAGILGSGLPNPAAAYLPIVLGDREAEAFSAACGARPIDELVVERAGVRVECHNLDYGPGGLLAFQHAAVYRELGLPPPTTLPTLEEVRQALRHLGSPALLARGPLAPTTGTLEERATAVRARIERAVDETFGESAEDRELRDALVRGYLDPAPDHEQAAAGLHLSRAAYFRRLRAAVARVAGHIATERRLEGR